MILMSACRGIFCKMQSLWFSFSVCLYKMWETIDQFFEEWKYALYDRDMLQTIVICSVMWPEMSYLMGEFHVCTCHLLYVCLVKFSLILPVWRLTPLKNVMKYPYVHIHGRVISKVAFNLNTIYQGKWSQILRKCWEHLCNCFVINDVKWHHVRLYNSQWK